MQRSTVMSGGRDQIDRNNKKGSEKKEKERQLPDFLSTIGATCHVRHVDMSNKRCKSLASNRLL